MRALPILMQTLGGMRTRSIVTAIALALLAVLASLEYKELGDSLQDLAGSAFYTALGGGADISTPEGFLSAYYFNFAPIIVIVVGIFASTSGVAGEEASGSLDLLLAQPVSRVSFVAQRMGGVALGLTLTLLAGVPFLAWGVELGDLGVEAWRLLVATGGSILLALLFVGVAYLACALLPTRAEAGMAAGGALLIAFFLQTLGSTSEAIEPLRVISPFRWAEGTPLLTGDYPWPRLGALLGGNLLVYGAAAWAFNRREIAGAGRLPLPRPIRRLVKGREDGAHARGAVRLRLHGRLRLAAVVRRSVRAWATPVLLVSLAAAALGAAVVALYPDFRETLGEFADSEFFSGFAGSGAAINTPEGFLAVEYFSWIPVIFAVLAFMAAASSVAGEEAGGTLDLLATQPHGRRRLLAGKMLGLALILSAGIALSYPAIILTAEGRGVDLPAGGTAWAIFGMVPLTLLHLTFTFLVVCLLRDRFAATVIAATVTAGGYLLEFLAGFVGALEGVQKISPYYWTDGSILIVEGFDPLRFLGPLVIALVLALLALEAFQRRDLAVASPFGLRDMVSRSAWRGGVLQPEAEGGSGG